MDKITIKEITPEEIEIKEETPEPIEVKEVYVKETKIVTIEKIVNQKGLNGKDWKDGKWKDWKTPTKTELKALIKEVFPEDKLLQKVIAKMPKVEVESLEIGEDRGWKYLKKWDKKMYLTSGIWPVMSTGVHDFLHLTDAPSSYAWQAWKVVQVKSDETGLEFVPWGWSWTVNTDASLQWDWSSGDPLWLNLSNENTWTARQKNNDIFLNNSHLDWSSNNVIIAASWSDAGGAWIGFQWNHTDSKVYLQDELGALFNLWVDTLYANNSIISNSITTDSLLASTLRAVWSGWLLIESNSGTDVALFGAGGGSWATFYGGVNIDGATRLATSLNGALSASSGVVSAGTLSIANGGTNATSYGANRLIFMNSGNTAFSSDAGLTFNGTNFAVDTSLIYTDATNNTVGIGTTRTGAISATNPRLRIMSSTSSSLGSSFEIMNAGSVSRLLFRDDGRLWIGTGTQSFNETLTLNTSGSQIGIQFTTATSGTGSSDGAYMMYVDSIGFRYLIMESNPHVFYISGSEVARFSNTGAVMQITGTLAAQYTGAGSTRGGTISLVSSAGTPQDWYMTVGGTDNVTVNGRSWFLYDNTNSVARFFVDTSSRVGVGLGNSAATAFVDIAASTSAIAQLRMRAGVAVSAPNDGELWYENTNDRLMFEKNTTACEIVSASAVTTEALTSDTTLTITYNGVTYKLLAKA